MTKIDPAPNVKRDKVEKSWGEEPISMITEERRTNKNQEGQKY